MHGISRLWRMPEATMPSWGKVFRDAGCIVLICFGLGIVLNLLRPNRIPFIQQEAYLIHVPCPEPVGNATSMVPDLGRLQDPQLYIVDARSQEAFLSWHLERAVHVPFDYLEPTPNDVIRRIVSSGAREVWVYGDGLNPDSGEQLARDLSVLGIRNVRFIQGGAPALRVLRGQGIGR
jgi:hypothetical protein